MRGPLEQDPEVLAERRHRDRFAGRDDLEREPARPPGIPAAGPTVERWPCRLRCGRLVDADAATVELLAIANRKLEARGEPAIGKHQVMFCARCRLKAHAAAAATHRDDNERPETAGKGRP